MNLPFFENALNASLIQSPQNLYRDLNQAFINEQWDNTTAKTIVLQQNLDANRDFVNCFDEIEVWLNYVVGQGTSMRNGHDFVQISFKDINQFTIRGRYYQFEDNYWITTFDDEHDSLAKSIVARRCNNLLKIIDPENGGVYSIPCAVDYDMSSPSNQVSRYIITPNNHAVVIVQGNKDTKRLFKTNTRYILGGRPFKLYGYQNAIYDNTMKDNSTLLYLDMYLDEIHDKDDLENSVADNGEYNYQISINAKSMSVLKGITGNLTADVTLNGIEVNRQVVWCSSNPKVVTIDNNGVYNVVGEVGQEATIYVVLLNNNALMDSIVITIAESEAIVPKIYIDPAFDRIREYQTINFKVLVDYGGVEYASDKVSISLVENSNVTNNEYIGVSNDETGWKISCYKKTQTIQTLYVTIENSKPFFTAKTSFDIKAVSMIG